MAKWLIGFGTGRCGTVSFGEQFNLFHEFTTTPGDDYLSELDPHDQAEWLVNCSRLARAYGKEQGDVSLDHINNLDYWLNQDVTRVCLMRDREETVESIVNYRTRRIWQRLFPQFDFEKRADIYKFWDWYYDTILEHEDKFIIISPDQLEVHKNETKNS